MRGRGAGTRGVGRGLVGLAVSLALVLQNVGAPVAAQNAPTGPGAKAASASLTACSEVWTAKTQEELNGYEADVNASLDADIARYKKDGDDQIAAIQTVMRDMQRLERQADQGLADAATRTFGSGLTAPADSAGVRQAAGSLANDQAAKAALADLNAATQKFADLRDAFARSVKAVKARQAVKASFAACVADQRQYLAANGQPANAGAQPQAPAQTGGLHGVLSYANTVGAVYAGAFAVAPVGPGAYQGAITWTAAPATDNAIHVGDQAAWDFTVQPSGDVNDPNTMFGTMTGHIDPATHVGSGTFTLQCQDNPPITCHGTWSTSP